MTLKPLYVFLSCFILSGCWFSSRQIPLPMNEPEFSKPLVKPFKLSAPRKIKWNVVPADSIHPGHIYPFDISKLPSRPFNPGGFNALLKPATVKAFDYNGLPDTVFNLDIIPSEPIVYKTSLLGAIKKITLGSPRIRAELYFTSFQYSEEQGLPGSTIRTFLHTRDGSFWIATNGGLCILNGESLEVLPFNYGFISVMAEDQQGKVWVRSQQNDGVFVIDRKAGIQKQINLPYGVEVRTDQKGFIWITSFTNGVYLISPDQKSFKNITINNGLHSEHTARTLEDNDGRIWITNFDNGVDILDPDLKKIKRMGLLQGLSNQAVTSVAKNNEGDVFVSGAYGGIDIINIKKETFRHIDSAQGIKKCIVVKMIEDAGLVWAATDSSGVYILNKNIDSVAHIGIMEGLGDNLIQSLDRDPAHDIFIATSSSGFNVFPPTDRVAHHLATKYGFLDNQVWGLMEDSKQRVWIGTYSGLNIITPDQKILSLKPNPDGKNNRIDPVIQTGPNQFIMAGWGNGLYLMDESKHTIERIGLKEGLPNIGINCLYNDSKGFIWMGTNDVGIICFDPQKRTIRFLNKTAGLGNNRVLGILEDSAGKMWVATDSSGLDILDLSNNTIRSLSSNEGLSSDVVPMVAKDKKNRIWVLTEKGLNLVDPIQETNTVFSISSGMPGNGVYSLLENEGREYVGTENGLVVMEEEKTGSGANSWSLQTYGKPEGFRFLNFNSNTQMITHSGQYWWGIEEGTTLIDSSVIQTDTATKPVPVTGIDILGKSQYFIDPALIKNVDTLWNENKDSFYLKGSFNALNSDQQKGIEWDSLSSNYLPVNLSLPPDRNYLRFHFDHTLPQYRGDFKYRYILDGVDEKWSGVTNQPFSENYNNIPPGHYTFRVAAKKGLGPWTEPSVYHFRIRPPWWYSWWAELIYIILFIGLVRLWVIYRSRRLLKENARLEEKITERTTALTSSLENLRQTQAQLIQAEKMASLGELTAGIAHEIQNPLNFVNNFSEVNTELLEDVNKALEQGDIPEVKEILKDIEMNMGKVTFHGKRADAIVKGMLLHSRASSGQKIPTDVNALADEYLRLSYHGLRAKDKSFNAQFTMDFDEKTGQVMLVQQDIGRVLLNLFNNAFYSVTEKKKLLPESYQPTVSVSTKRKKNSIEIRVRDNGLGIPQKVIDKIYQPFFTTKPAGQGTGLGLSLSYDIITKEHGGKIDVVTKENEFTEFIIELPIQTTA